MTLRGLGVNYDTGFFPAVAVSSRPVFDLERPSAAAAGGDVLVLGCGMSRFIPRSMMRSID